MLGITMVLALMRPRGGSKWAVNKNEKRSGQSVNRFHISGAT